MNLPALPLVSLALLALPLARAEELLQNGGFERPEIQKRTAAKDGGDPATSDWGRVRGAPKDENGEVEVGLTTGEAHGGRQALYISFRDYSKAFGSGYAATADIPVVPGQSYQLSIWGKHDPKDPLSTETGRVNLRANVYFKKADGSRLLEKWFSKTAAGAGGQRFFDENDWRLFTAEIQAPPEAARMSVVWACQLDGKEAKANGTILLDDASVEGPRAP